MRWLALLLVACLLLPAAAEDFLDQLPRIPVTEPGDTIKNFSVAEGFRVELVACEPLIGSPVAIEWDADGRLYVCEMRGYSENREDKISSIGLLEDTDGDGVFDLRRDFATGLSWPTALFPFNGGLFVGDAPDLFYLKDTDGDGKADTKKSVLSGFGTSNVQGLFNSFRWGLDNRIHVACGSTGGTIRSSESSHELEGVNIRGRDIAFDPRTYQFELTSGAAQHGMCFDDWGRKFVSSNSDHIQQVMYEDRYIARNRFLSPPPARISIAADGPQAEVFRTSPVEPWRIVRTRLRVAGLVPGPVEGGGRAAGYFTGATGVTIYRGDAWPAKWKGSAIIGDVGSNLVHRKRLVKTGLEFVANRIDHGSELLTSRDIWFRPAQFAHAPDGALHVIDVCREVIEHPKSLPPDIKKHLDLTSGRDRGRIYRIVPEGYEVRPAEKLSQMPPDQLILMLEHANSWHRETAARLLYERQDKSVVGALRRLAENSDSPLGRLHAMYVLQGLGALDEPIIVDRLGDEHPEIRRHAIALSEELRVTPAILKQLQSLVDDPSLSVRYQLAFTVGFIRSSDRVSILLRLIRRDVANRWIRAAVQSSLSDDAGAAFEELVEDPSFRSPAARDFLKSLASQISRQDMPSDIQLSVAALGRLIDADPVFAAPIAAALLGGRSRKTSMLARMSSQGKLEALDHSVAEMVAALLSIAANNEADAGTRVRAIEGISVGSLDSVFRTLDHLLDNQHSIEVQRAAIVSLGKYDDRRVAEPLISAWQSLSPRLRPVASEVLFARPERIIQLLQAVDEGQIAVSELPQQRLQILSQSKNELVRRLAAKYLRAATGRRDDRVEEYREALNLAGNQATGKVLFQKHCSLCHKVDGVGHETGPSLQGIKSRGAETILVNILDPNREVNPMYMNYVALTADGRTITGMVASENSSSITLRRAEGATESVRRADLDQLRSTGKSIMPEGFEDVFDKQSMADLIAYLMNTN